MIFYKDGAAQFLFFHIPRTAGQSIKRYLVEFCKYHAHPIPGDMAAFQKPVTNPSFKRDAFSRLEALKAREKLLISWWDAGWIINSAHWTVNDFKIEYPKYLEMQKKKYGTYRTNDGCELISADNVLDLYSFCVIRNPFQRIVSEWKIMKYSTIRDKSFLNTPDKPINMDFKSFVLLVQFYSTWSKVFWSNHWRLMVDFIPNNINRICRFENLLDDLKIVVQDLNLSVPLEKLPLVNASDKRNTKTKNYRSYYDDETIEIVSQIYKEDIERFEYSF